MDNINLLTYPVSFNIDSFKSDIEEFIRLFKFSYPIYTIDIDYSIDGSNFYDTNVTLTFKIKKVKFYDYTKELDIDPPFILSYEIPYKKWYFINDKNIFRCKFVMDIEKTFGKYDYPGRDLDYSSIFSPYSNRYYDALKEFEELMRNDY